MSSLSLVLFLSFLCLTHKTTADLIDQVCGNPNVTFKKVCESTLRADPQSKPVSIEVLVKITLTATIQKLEATRRQIDYLIETSTNPEILKPLRDCKMLYSMSGEKLHQCIGDIDRRDYGQLYTDMAVVSSNTFSCESAFKLPTSPLTRENTDVSMLSSNVVGIAKQVHL